MSALRELAKRLRTRRLEAGDFGAAANAVEELALSRAKAAELAQGDRPELPIELRHLLATAGETAEALKRYEGGRSPESFMGVLVAVQELRNALALTPVRIA